MIIDMINGQTYNDLTEFTSSGDTSHTYWDTEVIDKQQSEASKTLYTNNLLRLGALSTENPSDPNKQPLVNTETSTMGLTRVVDVTYKEMVSSTETEQTYLKYKVVYGYYVTAIEQAISMAAQYKTYYLESETINI